MSQIPKIRAQPHPVKWSRNFFSTRHLHEALKIILQNFANQRRSCFFDTKTEKNVANRCTSSETLAVIRYQGHQRDKERKACDENTDTHKQTPTNTRNTHKRCCIFGVCKRRVDTLES